MGGIGSPSRSSRDREGAGGGRTSGSLTLAARPRTLEALQPRVSWDRVHNRLLALPGSRQTALINGGIIPDVGQYAAYTGDGLRIGELDEEFIYERRVGDAFLLGTNAWRLDRIEADRVIVSPAEGAPATVPFWRGEGGGRSYDLGLAIGAFLRELKDRIDAAGPARLVATRVSPRRHRRPQPASARHAPAGRHRLAADRSDAGQSRRRATSSATGR